MRRWRVWSLVLALGSCGGGSNESPTPPAPCPTPWGGVDDGVTLKAARTTERASENLLKSNQWYPVGSGYTQVGTEFVLDNGSDLTAVHGARQWVSLNQAEPAPLVLSAWSKAEDVGGAVNINYSAYMYLWFQDGTFLYDQAAPFSVGSHDWERSEIVVHPTRPIKAAHVFLNFRSHAGKAFFRDPELRTLEAPLFDALPVTLSEDWGKWRGGFQVRDAAAGSGFVAIQHAALGLELCAKESAVGEAAFCDVTLTNTTGQDRAITLVYSVLVDSAGLTWLDDPRRSDAVQPHLEYMNAATYFSAGPNGRLSRYPFAAVAGPEQGTALGIDLESPAFYRVGYNADTGELFLAYDIGLTPEKPTVHLRFLRFSFDPENGFRGALARYYDLFPEKFQCRTPEQGLWVYSQISKVEGWADFGFKFQEWHYDPSWDDQHGILTFHYSEPATWWMSVPPDIARTTEAALSEAQQRADKGEEAALALFTSGFRSPSGRFSPHFTYPSWKDGELWVFWLMNSMPGVSGWPTDFGRKWSPEIREQLYGSTASGDLDGEYIDTCEGYWDEELDFDRSRFAAAETPLCFSRSPSYPVGIFRGMVVFEYARAVAGDLRGMGKLTMANGAPNKFSWLPPLMDVMGMEADWMANGVWTPMIDADLLHRRALSRGKPFCILHQGAYIDKVPMEKYMKRALAYGMFPSLHGGYGGTTTYFQRPELYNRDREIFKKYVPLCKLVAEAGWEPVTRARSDHERVYVERFGLQYLTVFNDGPDPWSGTIELDDPSVTSVVNLVTNQATAPALGKVPLALNGEDVAVLRIE